MVKTQPHGRSDFDEKVMMLGRLTGGSGITPKMIFDLAFHDAELWLNYWQFLGEGEAYTEPHMQMSFLPAHLDKAKTADGIGADIAAVLEAAIEDNVEGMSSAITEKNYMRLLIYNDIELLKQALEYCNAPH